MQYLDLARLVRYEDATVTLNDPLYAKASQILADNDADVQKADFTLRDLHNKKYTLSELRGKIVLLSFWSTTCQPCGEEMPFLDIIYTHYQSQGLVILSITSENSFKAYNYVTAMNYNPPVLIDFGGKVAKQFHIATGYHRPVQNVDGDKRGAPSESSDDSADGVPRSFVFNREGKLVAQAIDERTEQQLFSMLAAAGLHP
jgi:peroxiredoxin